MVISNPHIEGLRLISPRKFADDRGFFFEAWRQDSFQNVIGRKVSFMQDNVSFSRQGVLRGLHFQQDPRAQGKFVFVPAGRIYDVAVDIRLGSPTFGKHFAVELSSDDHRMLWIPEGFAHGFYVLSDTALVIYKTTQLYFPDSERAIRWDDPELDISWPLCGASPILSAKDAAAPLMADAMR